MTIPIEVHSVLNSDVWQRPDRSSAELALSKLDVPASCDFAEFYRLYWGPFHSKSIGHELLDLIEQEESVVSNTDVVRSEFAFPERYVVVSTLTGLSVLVYDTESEAVYDVDFEGGEQLLETGAMEPRWQSWSHFLADYF